jgi:hypothetical protein
LYFNDDGTIKKTFRTLRGVGIVDAQSEIQIDRYSDISKQGVAVSFLNETNTFEGWKISLNGRNTWVQFNEVDFGKRNLKQVNVRSVGATGGTIEIHLDTVDGPLLARVEIKKGSAWQVAKSRLTKIASGIHNLVVTHNEDNNVDLDWVSFE